jgi:anthranilate phosphoribosyltransferase
MSPIQLALERVVSGIHLTQEEAMDAMGVIMDGDASNAQIGALLAGLRVRGETVDEIAGFAKAMRARAVKVPTHRENLIDTCGTGGDVIKTFNISTGAAIVSAACGVAVAKHGNRAVTSKAGSADVLEALGVSMDLTSEQVGYCVDTIGIGFLFARNLHPAMRHAASVRAELGFRTVFNVLGPLTNPAGAQRQVLGVYHVSLCEQLAHVMDSLGCVHALVVHGEAGLDEISTFGRTFYAELLGGIVTTGYLVPGDVGIVESSPEEVTAGENAEENAEILHRVFSGSDQARTDLIAINAGAGLLVSGKTSTLVEGVRMAQDAIKSGAALSKLQELIELTNRLSRG